MKKMKAPNKMKGFTLVEMLLVLVIISIIIYAAIGYQQQRAQQQRIDRTSAQMQAILNAGLAFYVAKGRWPNDMTELRSNGVFLPDTSVNLNNPWGNHYIIGKGPVPSAPTQNSSVPMFAVWTKIPGDNSGVIAQSIAGLLPLSYTSDDSGTDNTGPPPSSSSPCVAGSSCFTVAMVSVPGQNLNNARAVNFAGIYRHGGCVPAPQCPVDVTGTPMVPQIYVVPASVSGVKNYNPADPSHKVYPISSFTAYAMPRNASPVLNPLPCDNSSVTHTKACNTFNVGPTVNLYWRVCLKVVTELGDIQPTTEEWGKEVALMAITRCVVTGEPMGTSFNVFSN